MLPRANSTVGIIAPAQAEARQKVVALFGLVLAGLGGQERALVGSPADAVRTFGA